MEDKTVDRLMQFYSLFQNIWKDENARFWERSKYFLTIDSALLAIYITQNIQPIQKAIVILLGFTISVLWFQTTRNSRFLENWRRIHLKKCEEQIEKHFPNQDEEISEVLNFFRVNLDEVRSVDLPKRPKIGYSRSLIVMTVVFMIAWSALFIELIVEFARLAFS